MSFYPDLIQILSRFFRNSLHPILFRFYPDLKKGHERAYVLEHAWSIKCMYSRRDAKEYSKGPGG
jgi:hypothetical protein